MSYCQITALPYYIVFERHNAAPNKSGTVNNRLILLVLIPLLFFDNYSITPATLSSTRTFLQLSKNLRNVKRWRDTDMQARWTAISLLDIEQNMNRIRNYEKLYLLKDALKSLLKIEQKNVA